MGRKKVHVKYIPNRPKRHITWVKRIEGMFKKGNDVTRLTGCRIFMFVESEDGNHIKIFSQTGNFHQDLLWMGNRNNVAEANPYSICKKTYTLDDYEETIGKDKDGNEFLEFKRKEPTSYIMNPLLLMMGKKRNSRIGQLWMKALDNGTAIKDGNKLSLPEMPEEEPKKRPKRKRYAHMPAIIADDDEILEAVGEGHKIKKKKSSNPEEPEAPSMVQSISVLNDGTINLSQTKMTITHENVQVTCQNLASLGQKFGFRSDIPLFKFSAGAPPPPSPPSASSLLTLSQAASTPPPPSQMTHTKYDGLIPGVSGDEIMSYLNGPGPPSLADKRIIEREKRNTLTPDKQTSSLLDFLNDTAMYGSFMTQ